MTKSINNPVVIGNHGFVIFFDNIRVDQFVRDYSVSLGTDSNIGTASINMTYVPDLDKVIHEVNSDKILNIKDQAKDDTPKTVTRTVTETTYKAKVVNCWHLAIRKGPGMEYPEIAWVDAGDMMQYHGKGGKNNYWVNVTTPRGTKGWAGGKYIDVISSTTTRTITETVGGNSRSSSGSGDGGRPGVVDNCHALTVRSGPGYNYGEIGWIHPQYRGFGDHNVTAYEESGGWLKIKWYHRPSGSWKMGWTGPKYIRITGPASSSRSTGDSKIETGITATYDDGVEYMTNVRIFVKNIFNGKYVQIFGGNITSKSTTITGGEKTLSFQATDYMNWLSRTVCPIAVPFDGTITTGDRLKWKAQGIDLDKVQSVNSIKDVTFKGKNISQTWQVLTNQTMAANKLYSASDTVSMWDNALERVVIMGDIDENLRKAEVMDFMINSSMTEVNSVYVLMNDVLRTLMFEFYQDRDETIRIKPPFWNEHVLKNHVIDPSLIMSFTESTDYNQMHSRVIATGGLDEWHRTEDTSDLTISLLTPVVAVTSSGITANSGPVVVTSDGKTPAGGASGSNIATSAVAVAKQYLGWPYVWGGESPGEGGFDCSGLIDYAYKQAGYTGFGSRETTYTLVNRGRSVSSIKDVIAGDLIFPHADHVYMAISSSEVIHAPQPGENIKTRSMPTSAWRIRRIVEWDGKGNTSGTNYVKPDSVGPDSLLQPTFLEKKYGPLIYDCAQPLIKFSTSPSTGSSSAYDALSKYARFMINYLNSSVTMASAQCVAMPWIRPGFNVWIDPVRTDKVFYVNGINHYGNASGNFTSLNMTLGRRRTDFTTKSDMLGGLKPGKSDDIFVNTLLVTPENFGDICNYNEIYNRANSFYNTSKSERKELLPSSEYFKYLYGVSAKKNAYSKTVAADAPKTTQGSPGSGTVTGIYSNSYLNVRSGPSTGHSIIGKLYNNASVSIHKESNGWYNITYNGNTGAWVSGNYVKKNSDPVAAVTAAPSPSSKYTSHSSASFLEGDVTISDIQSTLNSKYNSAPATVKDRAVRLKGIINKTNILIKDMYVGTYADNPISTEQGSR